MGTVTVRELLATLPDTPIYAGHSGLDKPINTISFIDSPSSVDWLNGGEVILTTAFLYKENAEMQTRFVQKLIDMGVVALGIKIGRYIEELPAAVLDIANKNSFPIFCVSFDTVWSEIFTAFHSLRMDKKTERNILSTEMITFDKLFRSSNWDNEAIRSNFVKCIGVTAVIVDGEYNILSGNNGQSIEALQAYCLRRQKYKTEDDPPRQFTAHTKNHLKIFDVALYDDERLILCADGGEDIRENELRWITMLYESIRIKNKFMQDTPGLWRNFLTECIMGGSEENLVDYARVLNLKEEQIGTILLFAGDASSGALDEFKRQLRPLLSEGTAMIHSAEIADEIIVLYGRSDVQEAYPFLSELRSLLEKAALQFPESRVWVGESTNRVEHLKTIFGQAKTARELGTLLLPGENVVLYRDLSAITLLQGSGFDYSEITFLNDHITSFDACKTLEIFLESGNIKRAAEFSFIHDNTMRYRIQKLEQCLNLDLSKPLNRINLLLKVKLWRIANNR